MAIHIDFEIDIQEVERIKQNSTITRLLIDLQNRLEKKQKETPDNDATKEFKKTLDLLRTAYDDIPKIVESYQKEYPNFVGDKLPKAEEQYKKLINWTDNNHPGPVLRKAIKELKEKSYDQEENRLQDQWKNAQNELRKIQSSGDQAQAKKIQAQEDFENDKKFKDQVTNWFKELDDIYKKAEALIDTDKYKEIYAYLLDFEAILNNVRELKKQEAHTQNSPSTVKDPEWLKRVLTQLLGDSCQQSYQYFITQSSIIELTEQEKKNRASYDTFKNNRRVQFVREAQDLEQVDEHKKETV